MKKILIVENNQGLEELLRDNIEKLGFSAYSCSNFNDVTGEFNRLNPNLVLMDINLPFYDGFYWCGRIRHLSRVPIIFISPENSHTDITMAIKLGGNDVINKPIQQELLAEKIKTLISSTANDN